MRRSILRSRGLFFAVALLVTGCGFGGSGVSAVRTSFNRGVYHYSQGNLDEAIAEYRLSLEENENDRQARFNLAVALEARARRFGEEGDPEAAEKLEREAEEEYRTLVEQDPDFLRAIVNLAACEYDRGLHRQAMQRLEEASERFDDAALPRIALAAHEFRTLRDVGSQRAASREAWETVLTRIDEGLRRDPASTAGNMLRGEVHAELARQARASPSGRSVVGLDAAQHAEDAREAYAKALLREPSDIATLMALGRLEQDEENWPAAAASFEQVILIDPDHRGARLALSEVLSREGDLEGATYNLWRARALDRPKNPELSPEEYRRRLLRLYEQLAERERSSE